MTEPIDAAPDAVAAVLADAFTNDPLFSWVFPADHERCLLVWWTYLAEQIDASGNGELWLAADGNAAAMWYPPNLATGAETAEAEATVETDAEPESGPDEPATGEKSDEASDDTTPDPFIEMLGPLVGDRMGDVLHTFGTISGAHPGEAHWYLAAVGTTTHTQSRGHGAALLQPALDRCDEQGLPA